MHNLENEVPSYERQKRVVRALVMNTSPVSILGCLEDRSVDFSDIVLAINIGNAHRFMIVKKWGVYAFFERHTHRLTPSTVSYTHLTLPTN